MKSFRKERLESLIKEELSLIMFQKLKDPAFGFATITEVKLSKDFKIAKIYVSVYEKDKREEAMGKFEELNSLIRMELAQRIRFRFVPKLVFYLDESADYAEKIDILLKKIKEDDNKE